MAFVPSQLLLKFQDLKLWQGNYDSNRTKDESVQSDYETIQGLSQLDSPERKGTDPDKRTIITPCKPFEQLLEEKLAEDQPVAVVSKLKRPFLRKGEGLARYRLQSMSKNEKRFPSKQTTRKHAQPKKDSIRNYSAEHPTDVDLTSKSLKMCQTKYNNSNELDLTPLKMPDIVIKPKATWHKVSDDEICGRNQSKNAEDTVLDAEKSIPLRQFNGFIMDKINEFTLKHFGQRPGSQSDSDTNSQQPGEQTLYERQLEKDLRVFEILEERVEQSSFSSTNTSIINLLASTPNKVPNPPDTKKQFNGDNTREKAVNGHNKVEEHGMLSMGQFSHNSIPSNFEVNRNVDLQDKLEEVTKKTAVLQSFLKNLRKVSEEKRQRGYSEKSRSESESIIDPHSSTDTSFSDQDKWSSVTSLSTEQDTTCKNNDSTLSSNRMHIGVNTSFDDGTKNDNKTCANCEKLQHELSEIKRKYTHDKTKIEKLHGDKDKLERELKKVKKKHEEDLRELREEIENEQRKLTKERMVFEKYVKDSQNRPSKKEREEISNLKQELNEVKELVKLKDTKNGATQARLRNQIKQLEKSNIEQKDLIEKLQKENAKLNASQKISRRPSEVKMLHEINKNLSKLTEETFRNKSMGNMGGGEQVNLVKCRQENQNPKVTLRDDDLSQRKNLEKNAAASEIVLPHELSEFNSLSVEKQYENVFGQMNSPTANINRLSSSGDKTETVYPDGSMEIVYSNGNVKTISPDGNFIRMKYFNGDIKETDVKEKTIRYYYLENNCWHTQYGDGSEVIEYTNGQKHKKFSDGKIEITYPEGSIRTINTDGTEEETFPDGSKTIKNSNGEQIIILPNGQKEVHTSKHKRREYPDGTLRILFEDGSVETRYPNGRIRLKDPDGVLVMDTHQNVA